MAFQPCPDIATVTLEGVVDGQLTINDLSWFASGGVDEVSLGNLCSAVGNWFAFTYAPLLSENWSGTRVVGTDQSIVTGARVEVAAAVTGGVSGEAAPNNVAACVSLRTAQRGRSARGRNFVPAIPNSLITLNTLDAGFIEDLLAAYAELVGPGDFSAGWQLVVLSRRTANDLRPVGIGIPVTSVTMVTNKVRSMRSREVGHGA